MMKTWVRCDSPGCCLVYDPESIGPHPLHARLNARESEYLDDLKAKALRGDPMKVEPTKRPRRGNR